MMKVTLPPGAPPPPPGPDQAPAPSAASAASAASRGFLLVRPAGRDTAADTHLSTVGLPPPPGKLCSLGVLARTVSAANANFPSASMHQTRTRRHPKNKTDPRYAVCSYGNQPRPSCFTPLTKTV